MGRKRQLKEVAVEGAVEPVKSAPKVATAPSKGASSAPPTKRKPRRSEEPAELDDEDELEEVEESEDEEGESEDEDEEDEDSQDEGEAAPSAKETAYPSVIKRTTHKKKKVLVLCSRGVTSGNVELMEDLLKLLPHSRKDPKFDKGEPLSSLGEIAELNGCAAVLYFEARKMKDLYMWLGAVKSGGPCAKFLVQQVRPMHDLRLTGNCLLGSRAILSFDGSFESTPHLKLLKQLFTHTFGIPKGHPRSKPFHDHVLSFSYLSGRVLVRHYQVVPPLHDKKKEDDTLVEIGPRLALVPIRILAGVFAGETLYASESYQSPNVLRAAKKRRSAKRTIGVVAQKEKRRERIAQGAATMPEDELADVFDSFDSEPLPRGGGPA